MKYLVVKWQGGTVPEDKQKSWERFNKGRLEGQIWLEALNVTYSFTRERSNGNKTIQMMKWMCSPRSLNSD